MRSWRSGSGDMREMGCMGLVLVCVSDFFMFICVRTLLVFPMFFENMVGYIELIVCVNRCYGQEVRPKRGC
jgi:hypothetical protein